MKRRGFFKSLAKAAAIVALAPQLAFRVNPKLKINPEWVNATHMVDFVAFDPNKYQGAVTWIYFPDESGDGAVFPTNAIKEPDDLKPFLHVRYKHVNGKFVRCSYGPHC